MKTAVIALCLLLTAAAPAAGAEGAEPARTYENFWNRWDPKWDDWPRGHLFRYVATSNYEAVLDDPVLRPELELLFGPHLAHFLSNILWDRSGIDYVGWGIALKGYGQVPFRERAILFVGIRGDRVYGAIYSDGVTTVFSNGKEFAELPSVVLNWVRGQEVSRLIHKEPETNFRLVKDLFR